VTDDVHNEPYYEEMVEQVLRSRQYVAFVGSGLSIPPYLPWPELIYRLCKACGVADAEAARNADPDTLTRLADAAYDSDRDAYYAGLDAEYGRGVTGTRAAYSLLMRLPFTSYVTTNFDPLLEWESRKPEHTIREVYALPSLNAAELARRCVFYIHGYLRDDRPAASNEIVLRQSEFESAYGPDSILPSFLWQLLVYWPVLFIGISLREPQLMQVFDSCRRIRRRIEAGYLRPAPPRYILRPMEIRTTEVAGGRTVTRDRAVESDEERLFEEMDVRVVRYNRKDEGHSGIEEMLQEWCELSPRSIEPGF
jgi:SIR2-like domain